jgi:hypothetical protein
VANPILLRFLLLRVSGSKGDLASTDAFLVTEEEEHPPNLAPKFWPRDKKDFKSSKQSLQKGGLLANAAVGLADGLVYQLILQVHLDFLLRPQ